jgi:hypothetical protein
MTNSFPYKSNRPMCPKCPPDKVYVSLARIKRLVSYVLQVYDRTLRTLYIITRERGCL